LFVNGYGEDLSYEVKCIGTIWIGYC